MKSCIYCGNVIDDNEPRCPYCGREQTVDRRDSRSRDDSASRNRRAPSQGQKKEDIYTRPEVSQETIMFDPDELNMTRQERRDPYSNDIYSDRRNYDNSSDGYGDIESGRYNQRDPRQENSKEPNRPFIIGMSVAGAIIFILILLLIDPFGWIRGKDNTEPSSEPSTQALTAEMTSVPITSAPPLTEPSTEEISSTTQPEATTEPVTEEEYTTEPPIVISSPVSGRWSTNVMIGGSQTAEDICVFRGDGTMNVTIADAEISVEGTYTVDGDKISTTVSLLGSKGGYTYSYSVDTDKLTVTDMQGNQIVFIKQ